MDIGGWLRSLGLGQYEAAFRENEIDAEVLRELSETDLEQLGAPLGHRKRLLKAIAALGSVESAMPATGVVPAKATTDSAERRQLTVMFCDLVGSTSLAVRLDPEDMGDVIRAFQGVVKTAVALFDGHVAKWMGDGALIYFGYPAAHEDDAERAARAALGVVQAVAVLRHERGVAMEVRAGIATGLVVVGELMGEGEARERGVVGETPNLAARLQALAEPGGVVIAESTRRLLGGTFELKALGPQLLKGFDEPVSVWSVLREAENVSRFEASRTEVMTPFVGREQEVALLTDRWRDAAEGDGQVMLLSGEAGIGKSRILAALRERIGYDPHVAIRYQCSPHHINDAFYPITAHIRRAAGLAAGERGNSALDKLEAAIARSGLDAAKIAPLLASLLSIPAEVRYRPLEMTPSEQKEQTIAALIEWFTALTKEAPVLAFLEDAHWIDATSLDVFGRLIDRLSELRVLLVITFRPDFSAPWIGRAHVEMLSLSRLRRRQSVAMIERLTRGKSLPSEVLQQIVAKTDGVPLFVEELTKTVLESGLLREEEGAYVLGSALTPLAIPSTLQDSLMARLDRLAPVKETAQIGAAIGREFSYRLLEAVSPTKGLALQDALRQIMAAELVHGRGTPPESTYIFKHALVQDTAYATLLKSRRQHLHQKIAETMRDGFPERADAEPGVIAHHFTQAGLLESALEWWEKAGRRAMNRFANVEAAQSFTNGLALLTKMPKSEQLDKKELSLRLALGPALLATRGYASPDVERNYEAANLLAQNLADREAAFTCARGLWNCFYDRGDQNHSLSLAERLLDLAKEGAGPEKQALAWRALGSTRMSKAQFIQSVEDFEKCVEASASLPLGACFERHGEEPRIVATQYKGLVLGIRGFADQGLETTHLAVTLAKKINHPLSVAFASCILCNVLQLRRDYQACEALANELIEYCKEQRFAFWLAAFQIHHGVAQANLLGDSNGAIEAESGISNWMKTGAIIHVPTWSSLLAEAALVSGEVLLAEKTLATGIEMAKRNGEVFALAELQRLTGHLLLVQNRREEAHRSLGDAVITARQQGANLYLLRAARDRARMFAQNGDRLGARALLQPIVDEYPEHRDGSDFQEAAELLSGLQ